MSSIEELAAEGEQHYWERVAGKVLDSYGSPREDAQTQDLGRRIRDAVQACGNEDMERMQRVLGTPALVWGGLPR